MSIFLANENAPGNAVRAVRHAGHDVTWIAEVSPRRPDDKVLARALAVLRVLIAFDKELGEMVFRLGHLVRDHFAAPSLAVARFLA